MLTFVYHQSSVSIYLVYSWKSDSFVALKEREGERK
jgi:hypothetical protein